ncbi:hypothetical protein GCM10007285_04610 [Stappia taiwanensis]|nr:hypothetical protein GCM10007285_04610 [Stappia taiwanensis]
MMSTIAVIVISLKMSVRLGDCGPEVGGDCFAAAGRKRDERGQARRRSAAEGQAVARYFLDTASISINS